MGLIQNFFNKMKDRKEERLSYERARHIEEGFAQKKLDANERELLRFKEEERKKRIKAELDNYRKKRQHKIWSGREGNPAYAQNVIRGQKNLYRGGNMFAHTQNVSTQPNVVKCKNITCGGKNLFGSRRK